MGCFQQGHPGCSRAEVTAIQRHNEHPFRIGFFERKQAKGVFFLHLKRKGTAGKREAKASEWGVRVKGALIGVAVILVGLVLSSLLIAWAVVPERWMDGCVLTSAMIGVAAGLVTMKTIGRQSGSLYGMLYAAALIAGCTVSGLLLYGEADRMWCAVLSSVCIAEGGAIGRMGVRKRGVRR